MSSTTMRNCLLSVSALLALYLSASRAGGLIVFGFTDPLTFILFALPVLAFPVQLIAFWRPRLGAALFTALTLTFGLTVAGMVGFSPAALARKNTGISLYILNSLLLIAVAIVGGRKRPLPQ
jgi:hypothetical protein